MAKGDLWRALEKKKAEAISVGDIVVSVSDPHPEPFLWEVRHISDDGFVTADMLGERFTPITGIYPLKQWRKVKS